MKTPERFTKRPLTVEAIQFTGHNAAAIRAWQHEHIGLLPEEQRKKVPAEWFFTREEARPSFTPSGKDAAVYDLYSGWVGVNLTDWIIRGLNGEFYPHDAEAFAKAYDLAGPDIDSLEPNTWQKLLIEDVTHAARMVLAFRGGGRGSGKTTALKMAANALLRMDA